MKNAVLIGLASVRANLVPMVLLWLAAAALAVAYYSVPCVAAALEPVRNWQIENGVRAAFATQAFFGGVVPGLFLAAMRSLRTRHQFAKVVAQTVWCGAWGIVYLWFYGLQARMFGDGPSLAVLLRKMAVDQFLWTPFVVLPLSSLFFLWMGGDGSPSAVIARCREGFVRTVVLPNLLSNWCVWIPSVLAVYAFPVALQVQMLGLASAFWTLMCLQIGRRVAVK